MPHTQHRKKTLRKALEAEAKNRATRSAMRTALKKARGSIQEGATDEAAVAAAVKRLDKAAKTRLIHPNKAARLKSRMARAKSKAKGGAASK